MGVGKTSVCRILAERYTLGRFIAEEVANPHLPAYYRHLAANPRQPNPHAYHLHLHLLEKRALRESQASYHNNLIIADRFLTEYLLVFVRLSTETGLLTAEESLSLERLYAQTQAKCLGVNVVYLLRCKREENLRRIDHRNREGEKAAFSTVYFDQLSTYYADFPRLVSDAYPEVVVRELDVTDLSAEATANHIAQELHRL